MTKKAKTLGHILSIVAYLFMFFSVSAGSVDLTKTSIIMLVISLFILCLRYIIEILYKVSYSKAHIFQAVIITTVIALWYAIALISPYTNKKNIILIVFEVITITLVAFFWYRQLTHECSIRIVTQSITDKVKNDWGAIICIVYTLVLSWGTFKWIPIWDDLTIINSLIETRNFDFTLSHLDLINGNISYAFKLLLFPGIQMSRKNPYFCVRLFILIYLLIDSILIYYLFRKLLPFISNLEAVIISLVFLSFTPVIGLQSPNPDYMGMIVLIELLFFYYFDYYYLFIVSAILLCFTKESLAVLYAGFLVGILIKKLIRKSQSRIKNSMKGFMVNALPLIMWMVIYSVLAVNGAITGPYHDQSIADSSITDDIEQADHVKEKGNIDPIRYIIGEIDSIKKPILSQNGFFSRYPYAVSKLIEMLAFHFLWIPFSTMLVFFVFKRSIYFIDLLPLLFAVAFMAISSCTAYVDDIYRDIIPGSILVLIVSLYGIIMCMRKRRLVNRLFIIICILFIIEQFTVIDPVTLYNRDIYSSGNGKIVYLNSDRDKTLSISSVIQINRQGYDYGTFIESILRTIDYDEKTLILIPEMNNKNNLRSMRGVLSQDNFWYDTERKKLVMMPHLSENKPEIQWGGLAYNGGITIVGKDKSEVEFDRVFLVLFPFEDNDRYIEGLFRQVPKLVSEHDVKYGTWIAKVVELDDIDVFYYEKMIEKGEFLE